VAEGALVALGGEGASIDKAGETDTLAAGDQAAREGEDLEEDEPAAAQLGADRYVLAAFFALGMMGAYVLGRLIHGLWSSVANKDWFSQTLPRLASVNDDDKGTIGIVIGGVVAIIAVLRTYKRPDIREWSDEVAAELTKVKWPNKKDVTNSTIVVIAASTVATVYLFLLDRLWAFVTNLVYGSGS
jgi:preprotein translocase subunit SecE